MTPFELLDEAVSLGVDVVQIADNLPLHDLPDPELRHLASRAAGVGLTLEAGMRGIEPEQLLAYLEISCRLSSPVLRTVIDPAAHGNASSRGGSLASTDDVVTALRAVAAAFERANVRLAIENHDRFPAATLRNIMERVDSSHVGICLDTANSIGCLESAAAVLQTLAPWVVNVHLKDYQIMRLPHNNGFVVEGRPLGGGQLDVRGILHRLDDLSYQGSLIVELWPPPQESTDATMQLERQWTIQSVGFLQSAVAPQAAVTL